MDYLQALPKDIQNITEKYILENNDYVKFMRFCIDKEVSFYIKQNMGDELKDLVEKYNLNFHWTYTDKLVFSEIKEEIVEEEKFKSFLLCLEKLKAEVPVINMILQMINSQLRFVPYYKWQDSFPIHFHYLLQKLK